MIGEHIGVTVLLTLMVSVFWFFRIQFYWALCTTALKSNMQSKEITDRVSALARGDDGIG